MAWYFIHRWSYILRLRFFTTLCIGKPCSGPPSIQYELALIQKADSCETKMASVAWNGLPVWVVVSHHQRSVRISDVPKLGSAVIRTTDHVVLLVWVEVQISYGLTVCIFYHKCLSRTHEYSTWPESSLEKFIFLTSFKGTSLSFRIFRSLEISGL